MHSLFINHVSQYEYFLKMLFRIYLLILLSMTGYYTQPIECGMYAKDGFQSTLDCQGKNIANIPDVFEYYAVVQFIDVKGCKNLQLSTAKFDKFDKLIRLDLSQIPMSSQKEVVPGDIFFKSPTLRTLSFTSSGLTTAQHMWKLPVALSSYTVDENSYTFIDASTCDSIKKISANKNNLKNIPKLHIPLPPIQELFLKSNPMDDLTVASLAPLCTLKILELQLPPNAPLRGKDKSCECNRLKKWLQLFNITGPVLECSELQDAYCDVGSSDMKSLREPCGDANMLLDPPSPPTTTGLVISIILGLLAAAIILVGLAVFVYFFIIEDNRTSDTPEPTPSAEEAVAEEITEESSEAEESLVEGEATNEE